jgi:hypothetical protein
MKRRFGLAALTLLLALNFSAVQARADNQKGTNCSQKTQAAPKPSLPPAQRLLSADPYRTAFDYLVTFYPRWFTWEQASGGPCNRLIGPNRISPLYQAVVAINVDTIYASTYIGAADEPVIVTIPNTEDSYSVLHLDQYGNLEKNGMSGTKGPGVYAIVGPNWVGTLPPDVIPFHVQDNYSALLFRADKYLKVNNSYIDMTKEAEKFRRNIKAQGLSDYLKNPDQGATDILPERDFVIPFKTLADGLIAGHPIVFLHMLQEAVASPSTNPLSADEQALSDTFDALFADPAKLPLMVAGAQAGHNALIENYHANKIPGSTWITFMDIADWNLSTFQGYLNRASITEYCQYCNNRNAAAYFHTFLDANRKPLDGGLHSYVLRFSKDELPEAKRFWSVTAYMPETIELVPNKADKYNVASYTPGLVTAGDGSVTILLSRTLPKGFPEANWLPIPPGPFNVMLRDYGPEGSVLSGAYVPPPVVPQ